MPETSRRELKKLQIRDIIAETALNLFFEKGLSETSVAEIMKKAGLGTGTFYNYFGSKEEVIKSCLAERIDLAGQTCEDIQLSALDSTQKLVRILKVVGNIYDKNRQLVELYLKYYHSSEGGNKEPPHGERFIKALAKIVLEGQNAGEFRKDIPCEVIVELFAGILRSTMSSDLGLTFIENINYKHSILLEGIIKRSK